MDSQKWLHAAGTAKDYAPELTISTWWFLASLIALLWTFARMRVLFIVFVSDKQR